MRRWIDGDITARQEAELQAAAEKDAFLREALSAYQAQSAVDHAASIDRLRKKIKPEVAAVATVNRDAATRPLSSRYWYQIAAAIALLLGVSWWLINPSDVLNQSPVAMENQSAPGFDSSTEGEEPSEELLTRRESDDVSDELAGPAIVTDQHSSSGETAAQPPLASSLPVEAEPSSRPGNALDPALRERNEPAAARADETLLADADITFDSAVSPAIEMTIADSPADDIALASPPAPPPPAPAAKSVFPAQNQGYPTRLDDRSAISNSGAPVAKDGFKLIEGFVVDSEGYPLIGASVLEEGTSNGTVTDFDGYFRLAVAQENSSLLVNYTGYASQNVRVEAAERLEIALEEGVALDDVVVTGLGARKRRQEAESPSTNGTAQPEAGYRSLKNYIEANTPVNTARTKVRLQFTVQPDGTLTDFVVLRSTNTAQNNLAIQLLRDGPAWVVTSGEAPLQVIYLVKLN